jgi:hypothetical protein
VRFSQKIGLIIENAIEHEKGLLILIAIAPNFDCNFLGKTKGA